MPNRLSKIVGSGTSSGSGAAISGDVQDTVTAAGSTQATATPVYGDNVIVTTAAASTGVILQGTFSGGDEVVVANLGASSLSVYPPVGGKINSLAANAAFAVGAGKVALFIARTDAANSFVAMLGA